MVFFFFLDLIFFMCDLAFIKNAKRADFGSSKCMFGLYALNLTRVMLYTTVPLFPLPLVTYNWSRLAHNTIASI